MFFDLESGQNDQWGNLIPSITPVAPNTQGIVGSFSVRRNGLFSTTDGPPYNANDTHFVEMQVEARAKVQTSISPAPVRNTLSPITRAGVWCKKCQGKIFNPFAEFGESINLFGDALSDLSAPINHSSSESSNPKRSMGYGWFVSFRQACGGRSNFGRGDCG